MLAEWVRKQDPYKCCLQETHFTSKDTQSERDGKRYFMKMETTKQKAGVTILITDKIDWKTKAVTTVKEEPSNSTPGCFSKETSNTNSKRYMHPYGHWSKFTVARYGNSLSGHQQANV